MNLTSRRQLIVTILLLLLALGALRDLSRLGNAAPWRTMDDFPDFYCAGWSFDLHASPYLYEPLHGCEHRVTISQTFRGRLFEQNPAIAVPAPQPPYDFLPFMFLARLSFVQARIIDAAAILVSVALCVMALARLGIPWEVAAASLTLSTAYEQLNTGQIVPFALLALTVCGLALARNRDWIAGILAALTAIEPATGFPVVLATLFFVPRARIALIATLCVLASISIALAGTAGVARYVTAVLPAHAASEVHFPFQYSLTYVAAFAGMPPNAAKLAGGIAYLLLIAIGLGIAFRVSATLRRRELLVFFPALCSVVGGAFVHQEELCFALPALLVLSVVVSSRARIVAALALCLLSIPWIAVWGMKQLLLASIFLCAVIVLRLRLGLRVAVASLASIAAVVYLFELRPPHLPVPQPGSLRTYMPAELVQDEWRDYAESRRTADALWLAIKLPGWAALIAALAIASRYLVRSAPASESSRESLRETRHQLPVSRRARTDSDGDLA